MLPFLSGLHRLPPSRASPVASHDLYGGWPIQKLGIPQLNLEKIASYEKPNQFRMDRPTRRVGPSPLGGLPLLGDNANGLLRGETPPIFGGRGFGNLPGSAKTRRQTGISGGNNPGGGIPVLASRRGCKLSTPRRCPITGRFLPRAPRLFSAFIAEHNRAIRTNRICRLLDLATSALALAGLVAAYTAFAVAMLGGAR